MTKKSVSLFGVLRAKISEAKKGTKHSAEHCAKYSVAMTGKKLSAEHCARY